MGALFSSLLHFRSVMIVFILCVWFFFCTRHQHLMLCRTLAQKQRSNTHTERILLFEVLEFLHFIWKLFHSRHFILLHWENVLFICKMIIVIRCNFVEYVPLCGTMIYMLEYYRMTTTFLYIFPFVASHFGDCFFTDKNMVYNTPCIWWNYLFNVRKVLFLEPVT